MLVSIIIGIVTLAFSYLIYRIQKIRRYPGCLSFTITELFRVMGNTPGNYQKLSLTYGDYQVKENLLYIKLCFFNDQSYDCACPADATPIIIKLPEGMKWVDSKVALQSQGVLPVVSIVSERELSVCFTLLRDDEFFSIEGLLESSIDFDKDELQNEITITHRIPNFDKIKKITVLSSSSIRRAKERLRFPAIYTLVLAIGATVASFSIDEVSSLKYIDKSSRVERQFYINKDNQLVYLKRAFPWSTYSSPITKEDFLQQYEPSWIMNTRRNNRGLFLWGAIGVMFTLILIMSIIEFSSIRRTRRVEKIINKT